MRYRTFGLFIVLALMVGVTSGCDLFKQKPPESASGVTKLTITVPTDNEGRSIEQRLIAMRLEEDNRPGAFKYVYVINAYTGTVMYQSIAFGKVVSSGKRLTPTSIAQTRNTMGYDSGFPVEFGSETAYTQEVLQDDGTYGTSSEYLYWFDPQNGYHQSYPFATYVHVSSVPLIVRNATLTMEIDTNAPPIIASPEIQQIIREFGIQP